MRRITIRVEQGTYQAIKAKADAAGQTVPFWLARHFGVEAPPIQARAKLAPPGPSDVGQVEDVRPCRRCLHGQARHGDMPKQRGHGCSVAGCACRGFVGD